MALESDSVSGSPVVLLFKATDGRTTQIECDVTALKLVDEKNYIFASCVCTGGVSLAP